MISLTEPIDFTAAMDAMRAKVPLPSPLGSADLQREADADLLFRSIFSARVTDADLLQEFKDAMDGVVAGTKDDATARLQMIKAAEKYNARGLLTNARLQLILNTNTALVRGYGQWQESNDPDILTAFPAQELNRHGFRKVPRKWREIWDTARAKLGGLTTATPSASGRLIALKNDPIWIAISDFGLPFPPFKWNSGMGVDDVEWETAVDLGLVQEGGNAIKPTPRKMNDGLKASGAGLDPDLLGILAQSLVGFSLVGAELVADDDSVSNRTADEVMEALCLS